jgi:hypothetical protein
MAPRMTEYADRHEESRAHGLCLPSVLSAGGADSKVLTWLCRLTFSCAMDARAHSLCDDGMGGRSALPSRRRGSVMTRAALVLAALALWRSFHFRPVGRVRTSVGVYP